MLRGFVVGAAAMLAATNPAAAQRVLGIIHDGATGEPVSGAVVAVTGADGSVNEFSAKVRIDTPEELVAYRNGGILPYVLRQLVS